MVLWGQPRAGGRALAFELKGFAGALPLTSFVAVGKSLPALSLVPW